MSWEISVEDLKRDMRIAEDDDRDDVELQEQLDAAITFVRRVRPRFNYDEDPLSDYPEPTPDLRLGTLRLASRWYARRNSPSALIEMAEFGVSSRIPSFDADIERLLRVGRHSVPRIG